MIASVLRTPVLIVGAGVAGSLLALELAHHGVPSIVVERATRPPRHPALNLLTGRSMELLRRLGLARQIRRRGTDPDTPADVVWSHRLDQSPVLVSEVPSVNQLRRSYASVPDAQAPVEPYLLLTGAELGGCLRDAARAHPEVDLREGWTFTGLRLGTDGAVATVLEAATGIRHVIESRFLAGCDGSESTVRRCLDLALQPVSPPAPYCTVRFRSPDLRRRPERPAMIIAAGLTLTTGNEPDLWLAHVPLSADEPAVIDAARLLHEHLDTGPRAPEVLGAVQWDGAFAVAGAYRRGPAFLAGESAHRLAPQGGAVDTCVGDAIDLGWKLAATINGWGGPGLLSSYEGERRQRALLDRELQSRTRESRHRFRRLAAAGASREFLAGVLRQEPPQLETSGTARGGGQVSSAVVWQETGPGGAGPETAPGTRPPAVRLRDGGQLFDRFGPQFTLVDLTDGATGTRLVASARARGLPMTHLALTDAAVRARWATGLALVRSDQHVAWRAGTAPDDWSAVLDVVTGHRTQDPVNT
jgi:2-polyprenyl-6-methoxyphenol hydroxylase-like FAD-dependent oxidoreductase